MDPIIIIMVSVLVALAVVYKDASAFVFLFVCLLIWSVILSVGIIINAAICAVYNGFKRLTG